MKFIHEVTAPMVSTAGTTAGSNRVELFASTDLPVNHPDLPPEIFEVDETISIEGPVEYVKLLLEDWLEALRTLDATPGAFLTWPRCGRKPPEPEPTGH